jgi:ParB family chromosome partitioning protein
MQLPIESIVLGTNFSRSDLGDCSELAASILQHGQQQPIVVREVDDNYLLISGYRRYHAMRFYLNSATIDARIETGNTSDVVLNLVENLQRDNLSFWDECLAVARAFPKESISEVARQTKKSRNWARPRIAVMQMSDDVQRKVRLGQLTAADINTMIEQKTEQKAKREVKSSKPSETEVRAQITRLYEQGKTEAAAWLCWSLGDIDKPA